ncbi:MAG TPA: DUF5004 domain-containing protein [Cyclobacteriaceae bacterium]|nr:DUF5004 domain-containing protein [Cyclobacteriaceae bacterium]
MKNIVMVCLCMVMGCSTKPKEENSTLRNDLIGEWRNIYLKVVMATVNNTPDLEKINEADSTNWEETLQIKPIRTFFKADSTYHSDYYNLKDSLVFSASGRWEVKDDTLVMNQTKPTSVTYRLKTKVHQNVAEFEGLLDFDEDGKTDDHYLGRQKKQ